MAGTVAATAGAPAPATAATAGSPSGATAAAADMVKDGGAAGAQAPVTAPKGTAALLAERRAAREADAAAGAAGDKPGASGEKSGDKPGDKPGASGEKPPTRKERRLEEVIAENARLRAKIAKAEKSGAAEKPGGGDKPGDGAPDREAIAQEFYEAPYSSLDGKERRDVDFWLRERTREYQALKAERDTRLKQRLDELATLGTEKGPEELRGLKVDPNAVLDYMEEHRIRSPRAAAILMLQKEITQAAVDKAVAEALKVKTKAIAGTVAAPAARPPREAHKPGQSTTERILAERRAAGS